MTVVKGLGAILSGGADFITFEEGKPQTILFIDWFEDLVGIREHYEPALNPKYVRCPGKDVCPLCAANPGKYPALRIKFRVYDPAENKVKFVSLAKSHIQKINQDFMLDEIDPTKEYVTIYRTGKGASDTNYSARRARTDAVIPNLDELDIPDIAPQVTPHSPEEIQGFMNALMAGGTNTNGDVGQGTQGFSGAGDIPPQVPPAGRKLPF